MAVFTCITEVRESFHLSQHTSATPEAALRDHIAALPYDDGTGPFDDELEWLLRVSGGTEPVEMLPIGHCRVTWLWKGGTLYEPKYITYVVRTDVGADASPLGGPDHAPRSSGLEAL
ncbi:hypothetical protein [Tautonia marina]|uniref:hypothetical protein n=1 Tax=Tautonia marina TaxID=2653855 RepID=UPI00126119E5|nr:hypothetical protein [Tautonia marina]